MAGKTRRIYTEAEKAFALATLERLGGRVREAARELSIPPMTLYAWIQGRGINEDVLKDEEQIQEDMSVRMDSVLRKLLNGLDDEEKIKKAPLNTISTAYGTLYDKRQLERGLPTNINENLTTEQKRAKIKEALKETGLLESHANN